MRLYVFPLSSHFKLNFPINQVDLINDDGCYKTEAGTPFVGKYVLTEGNQAVIEYIKADLLGRSEIKHSYPYDWRTKQPVIIKASKQWFVDTEQIKKKAVVGITLLTAGQLKIWCQIGQQFMLVDLRNQRLILI